MKSQGSQEWEICRESENEIFGPPSNPIYTQTTQNDNDDENEPVISILNVVVDYVMSQPTPFEPEEYKWKQLQEKRTRRNANGHANINIDSQEEDWMNSDYIDNDDVQVPIMRIFGPIIKGKRMYQGSSSSISISSSKKKQDEERHKNKNNHCFDASMSPLKSTPLSSSPPNDDQTSQNQQNDQHEQHQSGCLHIHGAYPYLLARPVQAGPDGSSFFSLLPIRIMTVTMMPMIIIVMMIMLIGMIKKVFLPSLRIYMFN